MGRERCLLCDRFIFDGEDVTRPASLGVPVHRHCYVRDAGLDTITTSEAVWQPPDEANAADEDG
jgi:hypothetical protein